MIATATWKDIGTTVFVAVADPDALWEAQAAVAEQIHAIDLACSRFRADSELMALNAADGRPIRVSQVLAEAIELALDAARTTRGAVDLTVADALDAAGYDTDFAQIATDAPARASRPAPGHHLVALDAGNVVTLPRGVRIDLGATAKAWAADRCADAAFDAARCGVLVSLGGDVAVAGPAPGDGWPIGISDDHADPDPPLVIDVPSGGVATSSTTVRSWSRAGQAMHHIIDPWTGRPARVVWRTVSVIAASCAEANVASTAAIVLGEDGLDWLLERAVDARLVAADGSVVTTGRWPVEVAA